MTPDFFEAWRRHETQEPGHPGFPHPGVIKSGAKLPKMSQTSTIPFTIGIYLVISFGRICMRRRKINILSALAGQRLGIEEVDEDIWLVSCMPYDLGYIDPEQRTVQTIGNPLGKRFSPVSHLQKSWARQAFAKRLP